MTHTYTQGGTQTYTQTYGQTAGQTSIQPGFGSQVQSSGHGSAGELHVLDDRDILTDLLLCQKQLLSAYGTATVESTNPQLRQTLKQISQTEAEFHTKTFELMQQKGWYETPRSDAQLAGQIASLWTQKMQRTGSQAHQSHGHQHGHHGQQPTHSGQAGYNQHQYGHDGQTQGWQQQPQQGDPWSRSGNAQWQTGHAAAKTWEQQGRSTTPSPGAYT